MHPLRLCHPPPQGSRKHYCVHKVAKGPNLDEECEKLRVDSSCSYFTGMNRLFGLLDGSLRVYPDPKIYTLDSVV